MADKTKKSSKTSIVLIVDRSGSMMGIAKSASEALSEFVNGQKALDGELTLDAVFFDNEYDERFSMVDPKKEEIDLTIEPRGMTALYDAIGRKVTSFTEAVEKLPKKEQPDTVLFVIATDGHENSSSEYTQKAIADLIDETSKKDGWNFTFIGANQDAVKTAKNLNINEDSAITFDASDEGVTNVIGSMAKYTSSLRTSGIAGYTQADRANAVKKS